MCYVNTMLPGCVWACVPVSYILLALHSSPTDLHSVPESSERNFNTNVSVFAVIRKWVPLLNGLFVPLVFMLFAPTFLLSSHISQSWQAWLESYSAITLLLPCFYISHPSLLLSSVLFFSQTRVNLFAVSVRWLSLGEKLLHTNGMWVTTAFSHCWKETSVLFRFENTKKNCTSSFPTMTKNHS